MAATPISDRTADLMQAARSIQTNNINQVQGLSPDLPTCIKFVLEVAKTLQPVQIVQINPPAPSPGGAETTGEVK